MTVICPKGENSEAAPFEHRDGVEIHRYAAHPSRGRITGYAREYSSAMWHTVGLVRRISRDLHFDVAHICNPPDFLGLAALSLKRRGARFIFDHHDLVPELYLSRFNRGRDPLYWLTLLFERLAFALADVVISTNDSYRKVALTRGRKRPEDVFVVRNAPDLSRFYEREPDPSLRRGKSYLISYVGVIGPQDGVDHALEALAILKAERSDWHAIFVGDGDAFAEMRARAKALALDDKVEFLGWRGDDDIIRVLSTSDVCLSPDPKSPLNEVSTMVKTVEYMAFGRPVVSYDLPESRVSAGPAAVYAQPNDPRSFAASIAVLLDDAELRSSMGEAGRARIRGFSWTHSEDALLRAYRRVLGTNLTPPEPALPDGRRGR